MSSTVAKLADIHDGVASSHRVHYTLFFTQRIAALFSLMFILIVSKALVTFHDTDPAEVFVHPVMEFELWMKLFWIFANPPKVAGVSLVCTKFANIFVKTIQRNFFEWHVIWIVSPNIGDSMVMFG